MLAYGSNTRLTGSELNQLASYIISLKGTNPPNPKAVDTSREKLYTDDELETQKLN
jgi:hypothetical protein